MDGPECSLGSASDLLIGLGEPAVALRDALPDLSSAFGLDHGLDSRANGLCLAPEPAGGHKLVQSPCELGWEPYRDLF